MKVILCEDIIKLGFAGETKNVADGYARNFLLPRNLVLQATPANMRRWESEKKTRMLKMSKGLEAAQTIAAELNKVSLEFAARAGREGHLFGSITGQMVADALAAKGFKIEKKDIHIANPIKTVGEHQITVHLHAQISCTLKVTVLPNAESVSEASLPADEEVSAS